MKAIVYTKYGRPDVLQLQEVGKPAPKDHEVVIRVQTTSVTTADVNARGFAFVPPGFGLLARLMLGIRRPRTRILGSEFAGEIEEVGKEVELFAKGDQVFGTTGAGLGAYAEYVCMAEDGVLAMKPANATFEEAAAVFFGAHTALFFLRDRGHIQSGQKVLINGASGSVGTAAVQLAKYYGAEVTGVCGTTNLPLVKSLGPDNVIDYTKEDFVQKGATYDLILDTVVGKTSFSRCRDSLEQEATVLKVKRNGRRLPESGRARGSDA